jgi:predicted RecA/RadA family phage recombinase
MAQSAEAILLGAPDGLRTEQVTAPAAGASGQVLQLDDGRAAIALGADASSTAYASGDKITVATNGRWRVLKTASINLLTGGKVYWDRSANKADFHQASGDFFMGKVAADAAAADATVDVDLNVEPQYQIELGVTQFTNSATNGLGTLQNTVGSHIYTLAFDAVAEAAKAELISVDSIPVNDLGIAELRVAVYDKGDDAALDINYGLADATHATDADSIDESVFFHHDGNALDIKAESDDGTTEVAATDTTVDCVDDTYHEVWIDCRNIDDIQLYIDGVNVLPDSVFKLDAATGPMKLLIHMEKTSNDTTADLRVDFARMRSTDLAV